MDSQTRAAVQHWSPKQEHDPQLKLCHLLHSYTKQLDETRNRQRLHYVFMTSDLAAVFRDPEQAVH